MLRIIATKMAALPALLGNATCAIRWNNFVENFKFDSMGFSVTAGAIAEAMHSFFPTNSTVPGNATLEYFQAISEGYADGHAFYMETTYLRERSKIVDD